MSQITISWTPSTSPVSGYLIRRGTALGNEGAIPINSLPITGSSYEDDAVFPGQSYSYAVTAVYNGVESTSAIQIESAPVPFPVSPLNINLGAADSFIVLASSTVTNVPGTSTVANADVGVSPGTSITGFESPATISGVFHLGDFVSAAAQTSLGQALFAGFGLPGATTLPADIGGMTLKPGLYAVGSSLSITGPVVLDASGDPDAVWIFQIGSTLLTSVTNSNVVLLGGAEAANVYWLVGSSATLGVGTTFAGNILAQVSITVGTGTAVNGRLLARTGAVTLNNNEIILFEADSLVMLPHSPPNVPPPPPAAPTALVITSES